MYRASTAVTRHPLIGPKSAALRPARVQRAVRATVPRRWTTRLARLLPLLAACWTLSAASVAQSSLEQLRGQYADAVRALDQGQWTEYRRLRDNLDEYPLALYLDFFQLMDDPGRVPAARAAEFAGRSADSPLANRFLDAWLRMTGSRRRWQDFLSVMPERPNSDTLQCFYYRAQLATGDRATAFAGARALWVHGRSRPDECDPLFAVWLREGGADDEAVWARMKLVFEARQSSLLRYVASKASAALRPDAERLLRLYREPDAQTRYLPAPGHALRTDMLHLSLRRLARYSPERALDRWRDYAAELEAADTAAAQRTRWTIAFHSLLQTAEDNAAWVDQQLAQLGDPDLVAMRLRWLLPQGDWAAVLPLIALLPDAERADSQWLYWSGVALSELGRDEEAEAALLKASAARDYYGFLAAERTGRPHQFNHEPLGPPPGDIYARSTPGLLRVRELQVQREPALAHSEWRYVLAAHDRPQRRALAQLAAGEGWYRLAIDAANQAAAYDALDLRFPLAYPEVFGQGARRSGVAQTELMAIARRESAFLPVARSPAGARGLMQLLPGTGRQVARRLGVSAGSDRLYEVEHNVLLGSAYYRQLLDRFDNNRVLALAAYNAGPSRVENWRSRTGEPGLPVDIWVETIPFRETRDYVKAVLAYNVVFAFLQGQSTPLFKAGERSARY